MRRVGAQTGGADAGGLAGNLGDIALRMAERRDAASIWRLAGRIGLDGNSPYAYLLLATHFADTCVVAHRGSELVGFVAAYRPPSHLEAVFVWQVGVDPAVGGQGLASAMLGHLLRLPGCHGVRFVEATVTPSNQPSRRLFRGLARRLGVPCRVDIGFAAHLFPREVDHAAEELFRIGPVDTLYAAVTPPYSAGEG